MCCQPDGLGEEVRGEMVIWGWASRKSVPEKDESSKIFDRQRESINSEINTQPRFGHLMLQRQPVSNFGGECVIAVRAAG